MLSLFVTGHLKPRLRIQKPVQHILQQPRDVVLEPVHRQTPAERNRPRREHRAAPRRLEEGHIGVDELLRRLAGYCRKVGELLLGDQHPGRLGRVVLGAGDDDRVARRAEALVGAVELEARGAVA